MTGFVMVLSLGLFGPGVLPAAGEQLPPAVESHIGAHCPRAITHTYEVRIRISGTVSKVRVEAHDAGHAKKLVRAQYGPKVAILSTKRID